MRHKVDAFASRHRMFSSGSVVLVAVSGGVDSMALLHFLYSQQKKYGFSVLAAHCNHGLRQEAENDEQLVMQFCDERRIPLFRKSLDLQNVSSIQQRSREMRYDFFATIMEREELHQVATAHHGDDQVETMLMQQMRGLNYYGGQMGISANRPFSRGRLVRPFLTVTKRDIINYAETYEVPWREDPSNQKEDYTRNRVRKHLLPTLKQENSEVHNHFQALAEDVAEDAIYLNEQAEKILTETLAKEEIGYTLSLTLFRQNPKALQRRAIHLLLTYIYHHKNVPFSRIHIDECLDLIAGTHPSAERALPAGIHALRNYEHIHFTDHNMFSDNAGQDALPIKLSRFPATINSVIGTIRFERVKGPVSSQDDGFYMCPLSNLALPLIIRVRNVGDIIRPLGLNGTQKIKKVMIDKKVPRSKRDRWPIITDGAGSVLWVPLLKKNEGANVIACDNEYLCMRVTKMTHDDSNGINGGPLHK